jgi:chromosomal replication initiator protein
MKMIAGVLVEEREPTIAEIQSYVAGYFGLHIIEMRSQRRARAIARPRQIAMFLAGELTRHSLPTIGKHFGNRDHTTVLHAIWQVNALCERDAAFARDLAVIRQGVENPAQLQMAV